MAIPEILTVGAGAVGAYFTGRLAQHGQAVVSVVVRSDFNAVADDGFHIESERGNFDFRPAHVCRKAEEYPGVADYIILTSKVLPGMDRADMIRGAVRSKDTAIVLIENGIGIEKDIADAFPENEIISAIAYIGATRTAPGLVRQKGASKLKFGRFGGGFSEKGKRLESMFNASDVEAECVENIDYFRWVKLLWNVPFNAVSVLAGGLDTREMMDRGPVEKLARELMEEVRASAKCDGVDLPETLIPATMDFTRNFPPYKTSMLVDYESGRGLEADAILGNVCRLAREHGVSVPRMEVCFTLLQCVNAHNPHAKK